MDIKLFGGSVVLPACIAVVIALNAGWRPRRRGQALPPWTAPVALGTAFVGGEIALRGFFSIPPTNVTRWPTVLAGVAVGAAVTAAAWPAAGWLRWCWRGILTAALVWLVLGPHRQYEWAPPQAWIYSGAVWAAAGVVWTLVDLSSRHTPSSLFIFQSGIVTLGSAVALAVSGSIMLGLSAGAMWVALSVLFVVSLWQPLDMSASAAPLAIILMGLWLCGYYYSDLPAVCAILLPLGLIAPVVTHPSLIKRPHSSALVAINLTAVLLPVAAAVVCAVAAD